MTDQRQVSDQADYHLEKQNDELVDTLSQQVVSPIFIIIFHYYHCFLSFFFLADGRGQGGCRVSKILSCKQNLLRVSTGVSTAVVVA